MTFLLCWLYSKIDVEYTVYLHIYCILHTYRAMVNTNLDMYNSRFLVGPRISLVMCPVNERRRCNATTSLIGWVHTKNDPCIMASMIKFKWLDHITDGCRDQVVHGCTSKVNASNVTGLEFSVYEAMSEAKSPSLFSTNPYTWRCRYNAVNFLQNPHKRHPTARPWEWGMGCVWWA